MKFQIVLELCNNPRNQYMALNDHLKNDKQLSKMTRSYFGDNHFIHFGYIEYPISLDELKIFSIDEPDMELFETFSDNLKNKIRMSPEWERLHGSPSTSSSASDANFDDMADDLPF